VLEVVLPYRALFGGDNEGVRIVVDRGSRPVVAAVASLAFSAGIEVVGDELSGEAVVRGGGGVAEGGAVVVVDLDAPKRVWSYGLLPEGVG